MNPLCKPLSASSGDMAPLLNCSRAIDRNKAAKDKRVLTKPPLSRKRSSYRQHPTHESVWSPCTAKSGRPLYFTDALQSTISWAQSSHFPSVGKLRSTYFWFRMCSLSLSPPNVPRSISNGLRTVKSDSISGANSGVPVTFSRFHELNERDV